jgi:hypothetical protein
METETKAIVAAQLTTAFYAAREKSSVSQETVVQTYYEFLDKLENPPEPKKEKPKSGKLHGFN